MACCYAGCSNTRKKNPELTFFRFPKEKERRYLWMKKCNNANIQNFSFEELQNRVVCESHFLPKCFDYSMLRSGRTRRSLFKFALPQPASVIAALKKEDECSRKDSRLPPPLPSVVSGSPLSPVGGTQKQKDLVSPQRLMNILENSCPLIRPISPMSSEVDDDQDMGLLGLPPIIPEVTMTSPISHGSDFDEEKEAQMTFPLPSMERENSPTVTLVTSISTPTTTVTKTSSSGPGSNTTTAITTSITSAPRGMTTKNFSEAYLPIVPASKRSLELTSVQSENLDWTKSFTRTHSTRKYKKILPKCESRSRGAEPKKLVTADGSEDVVLNLCGLNIQKLEKTPKEAPAALTTSLYLDNNLLQTLPTIDSYKRLTKVSLANNQIDCLIWFGRLTCLRVLNLSQNKLTDIDGLWKLWRLTHVNLSGNEIQVLRGHSSDPKSNLEFLDLSNNKISAIEDLSMLTNLKELLLHQNHIKSLSQCKRYLPNTLIKVTLAENSIMNLGDIAELSHLESLKVLSLRHNHCLNSLQLVDSRNNPVGPPRSFDYRPYVLTWCPHLSCLDDRPVEEQEKAKARWLFSQEKFRDISVPKHASLVTYLSDACPLPPQGLGNTTGSPSPPQSKFPEQVTVTGASQLELPTLPSPRSFSLVKITLPPNNNMVEKSTESIPKSFLANITSPEANNPVDCSSEGPCKHYIELIEEKAQNYKLRRNNEALESRIEELIQRIQLLETAMAQNGFNVEDLSIKVEIKEENEESEN